MLWSSQASSPTCSSFAQQRLTARIITITIAATFAAAIGATRVYLGHHWFTDVLAACFLGAAWLALVVTAHRLYLTARLRKSLIAERSEPLTS